MYEDRIQDILFFVKYDILHSFLKVERTFYSSSCPMNLLWFLLIGLLAGWLAGVLIRGRGYGIVADSIIGILGAFVGGFLFSLLGIQTTSTLGSLVMSVIGAIVFIAIVKAIHKSA